MNDWRELEAGPDLDQVIAEHFGWRIEKTTWKYLAPCGEHGMEYRD
jgi:hypothetical protein